LKSDGLIRLKNVFRRRGFNIGGPHHETEQTQHYQGLRKRIKRITFRKSLSVEFWIFALFAFSCYSAWCRDDPASPPSSPQLQEV
jgi:hypothetical protein